MTAAAEDVIGAPALAAAVGATARQITHWTDRGWLAASYPNGRGTGRPVIYPAATVWHARAMVRLVAAGVLPGAAHVFITALEDRDRVDLGAGLVLTKTED